MNRTSLVEDSTSDKISHHRSIGWMYIFGIATNPAFTWTRYAKNKRKCFSHNYKVSKKEKLNSLLYSRSPIENRNRLEVASITVIINTL